MGCATSQEESGFSDQEYDQIKAADTVASVLSFMGSGMIILCYICFSDLRKFAFKLVFYLSMSDMMASISGFIQPMNKNGDLNCGLCLTQAWILSIFELASVLWTACICHCLYQAVVHRDTDVQRFEGWYHAVSWGVPFFLAALPQSLGLYGFSGGWCWIISSAPDWRFAQFYIPLWIVFAYNFIVYAFLFARLSALSQARGTDGAEGGKDMRLFWRLGIYPVVLFLCWLFGSINRIHNSVDPAHPVLWLHVAHRFMGSSQGALNCVAYGMNGAVRARLAGVWARITGRPVGAEGIALNAARAGGGGPGGGGFVDDEADEEPI